MAGPVTPPGPIGTIIDFTPHAYTIVAGTPDQPTPTHVCQLLIFLEHTVTAGSATIKMGPATTGATYTICTAWSLVGGEVTIIVPQGWYVLLSGTGVTVHSAWKQGIA